MPDGDIETVYDGGQWLTRIEGTPSALATFDTKAEAFEHGRQVAIDRGVEHLSKNMDGTISERSTYPRSEDPPEIPG